MPIHPLYDRSSEVLAEFETLKTTVMKIVNILGGLGNQMFEYAMYLALKDAHPEEEIKVCTRSFRGYGLHNGLEIQEIFNIQLPEVSLWHLCKLAYPFFNYKTWQVMLHFLQRRRSMTLGLTKVPFDFSEVTRKDSVFYDGHWQNEKYFKHIRQRILHDFSFPVFNEEHNKLLAGKLLKRNSVSIHIRRGDYLKEPIWCVCTPEYYSKGIEYLKESEKIDLLCVFSDDILWCKENLGDMAGDIEIEYVDWNKGAQSFRDMHLMTCCKHNIIANSSFSWWGAWLGRRDGKIVIAPKAWCNKPIVNDPICEDWVRI